MVDININVENSLLVSQELNNSENDVYKASVLVPKFLAKKELTVDIAETTGFTLFGMMKSSSPIDCDVAFPTI